MQWLLLLSDVTPDAITSGWEKYGFPGLVIGATFTYILFLARMHREERKEWADRADVDRKVHVDALQKIATDTSASIQEQTRAIGEQTKAMTALHLEIKSNCGRFNNK